MADPGQEITELVALISGEDVEARKPALIQLVSRFAEKISEVTGHEIQPFCYFVDARARSVCCDFSSKGTFPVDIYEGSCCLRMIEGKTISSCHLLAFWNGKRVVISRGGEKHYMTDETYIDIQLSVDSEGKIGMESVKWFRDGDGEWESHTRPRTELYGTVEYIYDDY